MGDMLLVETLVFFFIGLCNFSFSFFTSASRAFLISWSSDVCTVSVWMCVFVCLDVNQGDTNLNRCTKRPVILHAQTY